MFEETGLVHINLATDTLEAFVLVHRFHMVNPGPTAGKALPTLRTGERFGLCLWPREDIVPTEVQIL